MANKITFTSIDKAIVDALRNAPDGLTLAEINAASGVEVKPGHIVSAAKPAKNLVEVIGSRIEYRPAKSKVSTYKFVTANALVNADGKAFNYTDNEKALLAAASGVDGNFTLAELAVVMNKERLTSGSINGLVKKGNIVKTDLMREVERTSKKEVNVYGFVREIPADAEIKG